MKETMYYLKTSDPKATYIKAVLLKNQKVSVDYTHTPGEALRFNYHDAALVKRLSNKRPYGIFSVDCEGYTTLEYQPSANNRYLDLRLQQHGSNEPKVRQLLNNLDKIIEHLLSPLCEQSSTNQRQSLLNQFLADSQNLIAPDAKLNCEQVAELEKLSAEIYQRTYEFFEKHTCKHSSVEFLNNYETYLTQLHDLLVETQYASLTNRLYLNLVSKYLNTSIALICIINLYHQHIYLRNLDMKYYLKGANI